MILQAQSLSYKANQVSILEDLNIQVNEGELVAIAGPNGAGKSSFLNLLANELDTKERKKVILKERSITAWKPEELALHKSKFSQHNANDIPLLVQDVVLMGRYPYFDATPTQTDLDIIEFMMKETDVFQFKDREYTTLSGGEKQRVHLARAFVQLKNSVEHKIMFLDEPLNNLDIRHQYKTLQMIQGFTEEGNAAVVVLHDLNLAAQFADRIFLMKDGMLVCEGSPDEVFQPERIQDVYNFPCTVCKNPVNQQPLILFG